MRKLLITILLLLVLPMQATGVETVQSMVDVLPSVSVLQEMDMDQQREAYHRTQEAYDAYQALSEEEQAEIKNAEETFGSLFGYFNTLIMPVEEPSAASNITSTAIAALLGLFLARALIPKRKL